MHSLEVIVARNKAQVIEEYRLAYIAGDGKRCDEIRRANPDLFEAQNMLLEEPR